MKLQLLTLLLLFITREKKPQQFQRSGCVIKVFTGGDKKISIAKIKMGNLTCH